MNNPQDTLLIKGFAILLLFLLVSCENHIYRYDNKVNTLPYNKQQIENIKQYYTFYNNLFEKLRQKEGFSTHNLGYVAYDTIFYYRYCVRENGYFIPPDKCNLNDWLTESERDSLVTGIHYLKDIGIHSCYHDGVLQKMLFQMEVPFNTYLDYRTLYVIEPTDTAIFRRSSFAPIDTIEGVALLREKILDQR